MILLSGHPIQSRDPDGQSPTAEAIRELRLLLRGEEFQDEYQALVKLGQKAFPVYLRILAAKDVTPSEIHRIFGVLAEIPGDRSQFLDHAITALASPDTGVRHAAVGLLAQIGSERDAAPVVALLSDKEWTNCIAAAKTLATIGDRRTLVAMNAWINCSSPRGDRPERFDQVLRQHVTKYRDQLMQRLEKVKPPEK